MKQYNNVYVPIPEWQQHKYVYQCNYFLTNTGKQISATKIDPLMLEEIKGPLIVLSLEELRILWDAARLHESEALRKPYVNREMLKEPDFTTYLTSKGINTNV